MITSLLSPRLRRTLATAAVVGGLLPTACGGAGQGRAAVTMRLNRTTDAPRDAAVYVDEEYVGPLGFVAHRGVRLPVGQHRITVTRDGYFPYDELVEADRQPIQLQVELIPIPD